MDPFAQPKWPSCLAELLGALRPGTPDGPDQAAPPAPPREDARGEAWVLLNTVLLRYLRIHAVRLGPASREELEDLAAEKSLELVSRAESGKWSTTGRSGAEIAGFLSAVARNGLLDLLRRAGRRLREESDVSLESTEVREGEFESGPGVPSGPPVAVERDDFARALCACAGTLEPRARLVWLFRVFYDMPTKEIAAHPEVGLKPGHVDVLLQRCRRTVRDCMARKGYEPRDMPPGTFLELWRTFRLDVDRARPQNIEMADEGSIGSAGARS